MNTSRRVPAFIESLTGITNAMVRKAPPVAHNASFDRKFWEAELAHAHIHRHQHQEFACSMLLARRLLPLAPSHKLRALIEFAKLPVTGRFHRALADAEMAASLLRHMELELQQRYQVRDVSHKLLCQIQTTAKNQLAPCLERHQRNVVAAP